MRSLKRLLTIVIGLSAALAIVRGPAGLAADSCARLASVHQSDTTILRSELVAPGTFSPPGRIQVPPGDPGITAVPFTKLQEFCWVKGVVRPTGDSEIGFDVWMPTSNWNHKFVAIGNGGFGGVIPHASMTAALARGYAAASTDTGHTLDGTQTMRFVLNHPQKLTDFGYRAVHEMTVKAKATISAYYGAAPRRSYWMGCSQGGRQGLMEAQRFPTDYDGISVGSPVNAFTHLQASHLKKRLALDKDPAGLVPPSKLALLHQAVLAACDARDGVKDDVLEDPRGCEIDPQAMECKDEDRPDCLTAAQVDVVRAFYGPTINPRTKEEIFPGLERGGELGWSSGVGHMVAQRPRGPGDYLQYAVFQDANWDYKTFDFDADVARADRIDGGVVNAIDPNLQRFFRRGGKLLQYHGWADPSVPPRESIDYYRSVAASTSDAGPVHDAYRLFMVPGMLHCGGGDGPNMFDAIGVLEEWVEQGRAPDRIVASHRANGTVDRTRPLCPYPQAAVYKGSGSTDDAANFICRTR